MKCRDCKHRGENCITSQQGIGLFTFSYCERLPHDCKIVEPDIDRECEGFEKIEEKE